MIMIMKMIMIMTMIMIMQSFSKTAYNSYTGIVLYTQDSNGDRKPLGCITSVILSYWLPTETEAVVSTVEAAVAAATTLCCSLKGSFLQLPPHTHALIHRCSQAFAAAWSLIPSISDTQLHLRQRTFDRNRMFGKKNNPAISDSCKVCRILERGI